MRERVVAGLRGRVTDADERLLLALLANLHDRDAVLAMVRAARPDADPRAWVLEHLAGLSGVERIGVDLDDDFTLDVSRALLHGGDDRAVLGRLVERYGREAVEAQREAVARHIARLRRSALAPLFTDAPAR
ncbi:MAG: hypothetical protein U0325_02175 [Polyangiales bacterium]